MLYFKKNNSIYYRIDSETNTFLEVFIIPSQCRVSLIKDSQIFIETLARVQNDGFESCTAGEFQNLLTHVLIKLSN